MLVVFALVVFVLLSCSMTSLYYVEGVMVDIKPTIVHVSWERVNDAVMYKVMFKRGRGDEQQGGCSRSPHSVVVNASTVSVSIVIGQNVVSNDMLRAYSTYFITVVAVNSTGGEQCSEPESIFTPQQGAAISPGNVIATVYSSTEISVQWRALERNLCRAVNGHITSYSIRYTVQPNGISQTTNQDNGHSITLTKLNPFTNYSIEVAAVNEVGDVGKYSQPVSNVTEEDTPGPVSSITAVPSFFTITITWEEPVLPNGNITHYQVFYGPTNSTKPLENTTIDLKTNFTTPYIDLGTEVNITLRAYTRVGPGESTTVLVSTLKSLPSVKGVAVLSLNDTAVTVLWNALIISNHSIDSYTVVYSSISQHGMWQQAEDTVRGSVTFAVVTGLNPTYDYQFQVFATLVVHDMIVEGERSSPINIDVKTNSEAETSHHSVSLLVGLIIGIFGITAGLAFGVSGCFAALFMFKKMRSTPVGKRDSEMNTKNNPSYGVCGPYDNTTGDYDIPEIISSPRASTEVAV